MIVNKKSSSSSTSHSTTNKCPCCGYNTLTEEYNPKNGTGYDICPLCGWEDDGTIDVNSVRSINGGSISDYRKRLSLNFINNSRL